MVTSPAVTILARTDRQVVPWRNGGGTTTPIAAADGVEPLWRMSIATIAQDGDFSIFPGVDRWLMPLGPDGLALRVAGTRRVHASHEVAAFAGELEVAAIEVATSSQDLNLMVDRSRGSGALVARGVAGSAEVRAGRHETVVVVALTGGLSLADGTPLARHDAVLCPAGLGVGLRGAGVVAVATVTRL